MTLHLRNVISWAGQPLLVAQQSAGTEQRVDYWLLRPSWRALSFITSTTRIARCGAACRVVWLVNGYLYPPSMRIRQNYGFGVDAYGK